MNLHCKIFHAGRGGGEELLTPIGNEMLSRSSQDREVHSSWMSSSKKERHTERNDAEASGAKRRLATKSCQATPEEGSLVCAELISFPPPRLSHHQRHPSPPRSLSLSLLCFWVLPSLFRCRAPSCSRRALS